MKIGIAGLEFSGRHVVPDCAQCCKGEHEHLFTVEATVEGEPHSGMVLDFHLLHKYLSEITTALEGKSINLELGVAAGTCEALCTHIRNRFVERLEKLAVGRAITVKVWQDATFYAELPY